MKGKLLCLMAGVAVTSVLCTINVKGAELQAVLNPVNNTAMSAIAAAQLSAQQMAQQSMVTPSGIPQTAPAQTVTDQPVITPEQAAQQQVLADALLSQQQTMLNAQAQQQKMLQDALLMQQAAAAQAQQSNLQAVAAIDAASQVCPQVDVVCDTNCAEQNALIYSKSIPDFVLVDISEQQVVFYKNGMRVLSDNCVTGNASRGHHTTVGVHKILLLDTNRTLKGSYGTAFVRYWMRFTPGGQGLHDAGWRNNFGNTVYVTNGSHGCVNLKRATAQTIYTNAYLGMPVIVEN